MMEERMKSGSMLALFIAAGMFFAGTQTTNAQTAAEVLEHMNGKYESISDAQIRFIQRVKLPMTKIDQSSAGTLFVKKSNKYRVELTDQTIVTNGETVWSYSRPSHQVLIDHFKMNDQSLTPERILTGAPEDFDATLLGDERLDGRKVVGLKLTPKGKNSFISSMKLWVDNGDWMIRKVEVSDAAGKNTTYTVSDIKTDTGLKDSRFTYQIPEGAEVVDLR